MARRVAILQSNYIPWKGYFDIVHDVDEFVFLDTVQYTKQDWRNRNRIKTPNGPRWLTVPVGRDHQRRMCDVELPAGWAAKHWRRLKDSYGAAPCFSRYREALQHIYLERSWRYLSDLNQHLIRTIAHDLLGLRTVFRDAREFQVEEGRQERLLSILRATGAGVFVSGPAAKSYIEADRFAASGIEIAWKDYSGYPEYPQLHPPFDHAVTILDLLVHTGLDAPRYIWGWRSEPS